jgi:glucose-1-phosphate thymidylyltransferase
MIYNPIKKLIFCDIKDILIVTSTLHMGEIVNLFGIWEQFGVDFACGIQGKAKEITHALKLSRGEKEVSSIKKIIV